MCMGSAPSMPAPAPLPAAAPPPPNMVDPAVLAARQSIRDRATNQGRGGTVLTTPQGTLDTNPDNKKTLLGQ